MVEPTALHYFNQGNQALQQLNYLRAARWFQRAVEEDDRHAEFYYNLGLTHQRAGVPQLAVRAYQQALQVNPQFAQAHHNLALVHHQQQNPQLANAHYHRYRQIVTSQGAVQAASQATTANQALGQTAAWPAKQRGSSLASKKGDKKGGKTSSLAYPKGDKAVLAKSQRAGAGAKTRAGANPAAGLPANVQGALAVQMAATGNANANAPSLPPQAKAAMAKRAGQNSRTPRPKTYKQPTQRRQSQPASKAQGGGNPFAQAPQNQQGEAEWWNAQYYQTPNR